MDATTQDGWIERLKGPASERDPAIAELRGILVRGLTKALSTRYGSGIQAEDVVQDSLIKILDSLDKFEGRSRFTTWAMSIAIRIGISELRRRHYKNVSLESMTTRDDLQFELVASEDVPAEKQLDRKKIVATLKRLVDNELTDKQRVATQGLLDGLPVEEIARRSDSNRNAVYKLIHDARARLRDGFAASGVSLDDLQSIFS